jgi:hypothetical protein
MDGFGGAMVASEVPSEVPGDDLAALSSPWEEVGFGTVIEADGLKGADWPNWRLGPIWRPSLIKSKTFLRAEGSNIQSG